ncbi:MAG: hypothetical protein ABC612_08145 [Candidatus Methanosuratincola petrocarbonis]
MGAGVLLVVAFPLYFMIGTPRPLADATRFTDYLTKSSGIALTTKLVDTLYIAGFLVFLAGFRHLIRKARPEYEWVSTLVFGVGLVGAAVTLVGDTLGAGAALDTFNKPDPTVVRALTEATLPAFGAIGLIISAFFLASASYAILATRALPRWTGWVGYIGAILNVVAVPSIYGGNDFMEAAIAAGGTASSGFYSYATSVAGLVFLVWLFSAAISMIVKREAVAPTPVAPCIKWKG